MDTTLIAERMDAIAARKEELDARYQALVKELKSIRMEMDRLDKEAMKWIRTA